MQDDNGIEELNGIYKDFARILDIESSKIIYENFKGQQINFPVRFLSREKIAEFVIEKYDGSNIKALVKEFGYSERWIRNLIKQNRENDDSQKHSIAE